MSRNLRISAMVVIALFGVAWWAHAQNQKQNPAEAPKKPAAPKAPGAAKAPAAPAPGATKAPAKPAATTDKKAADKKEGDKARAERRGEDDEVEAAIRASAEAFVAAYNAHDATAIATMFSPKAEIIDEDGELTKGREAIEQSFARQFEAHPKASITVDIESIRALTPNIAVEEGIVRGESGDDDGSNVSRYVVVHVKVDKIWQVASVRDFDAGDEDLTPHEHLEELNWLIGEWVDESPDATVHTHCDWDDSGNFIIQHFSVHISGEVSMSGTQRIGWNPPTHSFKSWVFDSEGGHSEGIWTRYGDEWVIKSQGVSGSGDVASSTNVYRQIDDETLGWSSHHRVVNGEAEDSIDEIVVKRRPPDPSQ